MRCKAKSRSVIIALLAIVSAPAAADAIRQTKGDFYDAFRQLDVDLPTPNVYRTASGAPGEKYWQQEASHKIRVKLDEKALHITASQDITYKNNSPDTLRYLWLQLDQNKFRRDSIAVRSETATEVGGRRNLVDEEEAVDTLNYSGLARKQAMEDRDYGFDITAVKDGRGKPLQYTIVDTMMRIDLPQALRSGQTTSFSIDWEFNIVHEVRISARGGYEYFPEDDTYLFFLAQWFPRLAAYTDYAGWQHKAFLGRGEFTLEFGDYEVEITVPADHIVSSTGVLQNPSEVLTAQQRQRLKQAETAKAPVFIVTPEEAAENEREGTDATATWVFKAKNVRDFAWASSRKFIWDAMGHRQDDSENPLVMAMSFYPKEAEPIWSKYSTHAVIHTMDVYSSFSFPYPYPTAQSVNTWKSGGMEYPMITFNGYRPDPFEAENAVEGAPDRTYSRRIKYGLIGVIIHEIGHIYFPMTVNSDERQWTWMDEGINSFLDYVSAIAWEENYPSYGDNVNVLDSITEYMVSENQVPIMTQSDSILQFGPNAYSKPTAALIVLRET
ncbi:MAG TPA: M1 family metallopeptidase, partial [Woeseiaceae bacterium]